MSEQQPRVDVHQLFPTTVVNLQFEGAEIEALNDKLVALIRTSPAFRGKNLAEYGSDDFNLLDHAAEHPCVDAVTEMFARGVDAWLRATGYKGTRGYSSRISLFPSYLKPGQATAPHNHARTELVGVYYVSCAPTDAPPLRVCTHGEWYRQDDGPLWLLDPRFNATLTELSETMCAKLFPRTGLLTIFPGYLWHGVAPNTSSTDRFAVAANISVVPDDAAIYREREFRH